jgi:hypothetical protein
MSLPSAWMNPFLSKGESFHKTIENLDLTYTKHLLIVMYCIELKRRTEGKRPV